MEAYEKWIQRLYDEWPISEEMLSTGRIKKKNAGEVSITILSEIISWYYPKTKTLTIYSQDGDTYDFQRKAEADLRKLFAAKMPVPISYKSNDAILCQLVREGKINIVDINEYRKDVRKITYSKEQDDHAIVLVTELVNNELFAKLVSDKTMHIIFLSCDAKFELQCPSGCPSECPSEKNGNDVRNKFQDYKMSH